MELTGRPGVAAFCACGDSATARRPLRERLLRHSDRPPPLPSPPPPSSAAGALVRKNRAQAGAGEERGTPGQAWRAREGKAKDISNRGENRPVRGFLMLTVIRER